jgi:hypothetical protein
VIVHDNGKNIYINIEVTDCGNATAKEMEVMKIEKDRI